MAALSKASHRWRADLVSQKLYPLQEQCTATVHMVLGGCPLVLPPCDVLGFVFHVSTVLSSHCTVSQSHIHQESEVIPELQAVSHLLTHPWTPKLILYLSYCESPAINTGMQVLFDLISFPFNRWHWGCCFIWQLLFYFWGEISACLLVCCLSVCLRWALPV